MRTTKRLVCTFALLLAVPGTAAGDDAGIKKAGEKIGPFARAVITAKAKGAEVAGHGVYGTDPSKCTDAIAEAEQAGATDATRVYGDWPDTLPTYKYEASIGSSITLEAARGVCADFAIWAPAVKAAPVVQTVLAYLKEMDRDPASGGVYAVQEGKTCLDTLDGLDAAARAVAVKIGSETMTLDEGRKRCQEAIERGGKSAKAQAAASGAKRAEIEAKWKKVGMKGAKLKLFVDNELNGGGFDWYAAGCQTVISDPKKLAKAKKLFMWTAGANGGTLVTKIVFKGNKYKETSREFFDEGKAYRFCR